MIQPSFPRFGQRDRIGGVYFYDFVVNSESEFGIMQWPGAGATSLWMSN